MCVYSAMDTDLVKNLLYLEDICCTVQIRYYILININLASERKDISYQQK